MKPTYYKLGDFEAGAFNTGKRTANYYVYAIIYDENMKSIPELECSFFGRWTKCEHKRDRWIRDFEKLGLKRVY